MRATQIIFVVRKQSDVELLTGLDAAAGGMRRLIVQVAGEANSLTTETLRRLRRSQDLQKRRTPVVVWAANAQDAELWRDVGALTVSGKMTREAAAKALSKAPDVPWVESSAYIGPDRRHKRTWLNRSVRRLDDSPAAGQPDLAPADSSSFETRMRQIRLAAFDIGGGDRVRRAQFLNDVRSAVRAAERARLLHAARVMDSLVRYLKARGATGGLDQALIEAHLEAAIASPTDGAGIVARLERRIDRALGLGALG